MQLFGWLYNNLPDLRGKQPPTPPPQTPQQKCESALATARNLLRRLQAQALSDPEPLRLLIAAAEPHANGGRYDQALTELGDYQKVFDQQAAKAKEKRDYFFGTVDANRVQFSTGRDITLVPRQQGPPLNYFIYPYVEVDGKPDDAIEKQFSFEAATPSQKRPAPQAMSGAPVM